MESGYLGSYEDGLAAGVSFRDLLPYERLTARPWCLDFTVHSFHDLFDRSFFFFPFASRVSADCDPSSTIGILENCLQRTKQKRRSRLEIYILKEKKCFLKDGDSKISMIRIVQGSRRKEWKTSSLMSFILLFHEEDVQPTRE